MDLLAIYLRDHLAGATAGVELVKRVHGANRASAFGPPLATLRTEIEEDRDTLIGLLERAEVGRDRLKEVAMWSAEKVGRLKLNGRLLGYSPLSRVLELETLAMLVEGKRSLWRTLADVCGDDARFVGIDFGALQARAESQQRRLDELRTRAATAAFR